MKCRHCAHEVNVPFFDLGSAPLSNAYLTEAALRGPEVWYPLRLLVCDRCWLVQTEYHAGPEELFDADYAYFSSYSSSWLAHAKDYVHAMQARYGLGPQSCVVEVAANDGYLLQYVREMGVPCYGVEPTASTAATARAKGIEIVERFFGVELARELVAAGRQADLIAANNVLAHVPEINDFVAGFAALLKEQGVATFEFPHFLRMVQENQFDTVYHEHYSYLSLTAVANIFSSQGLQVFDVEELSTHGGSLRVYAQRRDAGRRPVTAAVAALLAREQAAGVMTPEFYAGFQKEAERIKRDLMEFLLQTKRWGLKVGAYGAAAKGNTLMNFSGVRPGMLPYVVDLNPAKQGKYMPGSRIPIVGEAHLRKDRPDYVFILPWNLRGEIMAQLSYIRDWGGRFITAVPRLTIEP